MARAKKKKARSRRPAKRASAPTTPPGHRRVSALVGFLQQGEIDPLFRQNPWRTASGEDPLDVWRRFDAQRAQLAPVPPGQLVAPPTALHRPIDAITHRQSFIEFYARQAAYRIASAPIESLLAPQLHADLDYIDEISKRLSDRGSQEAQLEFAFPEGRLDDPIVSGGSVVFASPRVDLAGDLTPRVQRLANGEFTISVRVISRPNYIQVVEIGNQLLLGNGVHKVCALYRAGFTHCYCAVKQAPNLNAPGLPQQLLALPMLQPPVFQGQRPAAVTDYLRPETGAPLLLRATNQVLQVHIQPVMMSVPALP
jgi:hypothetical protein